jgi:subtilisin family serine protease
MKRLVTRMALAIGLAGCMTSPMSPEVPDHALTVPDVADTPAPVRPNDPLFPRQAYLRETGIDRAWSLTKGDPKLSVGILDNGVNRVSDLRATPLTRLFWQTTKADHGTPIAALVAATQNDGYGIAGVAACSLVSLHAPQYSDGAFMAPYIIKGIDEVRIRRLNVLNCSFGSGSWTRQLREATTGLVKSGTVVVAAALNDGMPLPVFPAADPGVISVGATETPTGLALFSNWGDWVTLYAPGERLIAPDERGNHETYKGTSFATALVTGTIVLMLSVNPKLTPRQIKAILQSTADRQSYGRFLNAYKAVRAAQLLNKPQKF